MDDFVPVSNTNKIMCSISRNKNEMWVSLLEKALLKTKDGYNIIEGFEGEVS